jgi:hypothetical protein
LTLDGELTSLGIGMGEGGLGSKAILSWGSQKKQTLVREQRPRQAKETISLEDTSRAFKGGKDTITNKVNSNQSTNIFIEVLINNTYLMISTQFHGGIKA